MATDKTRGIESAQGLVAFVGITLGVIPLIQVVLGRRPGLLTLVLSEGPSASHWIAPLVVVLAATVLVFVLELRKNRR
ncbi:MAG: hypothetical protein QM705_11000 [Ancrocorticia sp.]